MKTQEQIKKEVITYLQKTSQHLFEKEGTLMKVLYFKEEETEYYAIVKIKDKDIQITTQKVWNHEVHSQQKFFLKHHYLFQSWDSKKWNSIRHFKKIKNLLNSISENISSSADKNKELISKLKKEGLVDLKKAA